METASATRREKGREQSFSTGFPVRCTDAEKQEIFARAAQAKRSASRFLVELAVRVEADEIRSRPSPEELAVLEGLVVQLRRLGTNLNEIARHQEAADYQDDDGLTDAELSIAVREVRSVVDQVRSLFR